MNLFTDDVMKEIASTVEDLTSKAIDKALADYRKVYRVKDYMNAQEAGEYLGISYGTLQNLRVKGLKVLTIGDRTIYSKKAIEEFYHTEGK